MKEFEPDLLVTYNGNMQLIQFNRPEKKNAFRMQTYVGLPKALEAGAKDDNVTLTVITGVGEYFSSGNDLEEMAKLDLTNFEAVIKSKLKLTRDFVRAFIDYPKLLIAVVNGPAIGIAVTTLGLCDIVYCVDTATFQTPFTSLGITAEGCSSYTFPRIMGPSLAGQMLYLNHKMGSMEAKKCGFVAQMTTKTRLPALFKLLAEHAKLPQKSLIYTKQIVRGQEKEILHKINDQEIERLEERFQSEEAFEALTKFASRKQGKKSKL